MAFALLIIGFLAGALAIDLSVAAKAPMGYQDATGFHLNHD